MTTRFPKYYPFVSYVSMWVAISAIHFFLLNLAWDIPTECAAIDSLVFNTTFSLAGMGLWFWTKYSDLRKRSLALQAINHLASAALIILLWMLVSYQLINILCADDGMYLVFVNKSLIIRVVSGMFFYLLLAAVFSLMNAYRELYEKTLLEGELKSMVREAELNALRSQIKPHFLFNSLNSINALIIRNPEKAQEMIIKLSEFMRYSLSHQDKAVIPLEQELYHMTLYLEIEKIRFSDRLSIEQDICETCYQIAVPAMILQPLLENAIKHGVYESLGSVSIQIYARRADDVLTLTISNNYDPELPARKGTGTGLKNVAKRLAAIYARSDLMQVIKQGSCFTVELKIPYR